jgi:predicted kinase
VAEAGFPSELVDRLARIAGASARAVVLVDGGSGSGKSTLARSLAERLSAQLVQLDDIYPGWDGLQEASEHVFDEVLSRSVPRWRGWDWVTSEPTNWHDLDPALPLVIEGSGALSRRNRTLATLGVWVELDEVTRKKRALARDGETYAPQWDRWAAQEREFAAREHPAETADVLVRVDTGELVERSL